MKYKVTVETEVIVEFDENSEEFKSLFENYNKFFADVELEGFVEMIAKEAVIWGIGVQIEGVGLPKFNGKMQRESYFPLTAEIDHPVNLIGTEDMNSRIELNCYAELVEEEK